MPTLSREANIRRFNDLGLAVHITEMDIWLKTARSPGDLDRQAEAYARSFAAALAAPNCQAILTWGMTDRHSWIPHFTKGAYGHALLFDETFAPKPAYFAAQAALARA